MKRFIYLITSIVLFCASPSLAGIFELKGTFNYSRSNFDEGSYSWTKRYGLSLGYFFTQDSELEFSFQDGVTHTVVNGVQDTYFHDQVFSLNLNYFLLDETAMFRPFVKGGAGQLNRDATGSYVGGGRPPGRTDQLTGVLGAGVRLRATERLSFSAEFNTYLAGGAISTWKDNLALMVGTSLYF